MSSKRDSEGIGDWISETRREWYPSNLEAPPLPPYPTGSPESDRSAAGHFVPPPFGPEAIEALRLQPEGFLRELLARERDLKRAVPPAEIPFHQGIDRRIETLRSILGSRHTTSQERRPVPAPNQRGYRAEIKTWMKKNEIDKQPDAAKRLGVSYDVLKAIMRGDSKRYSAETLQWVLKKIGAAE